MRKHVYAFISMMLCLILLGGALPFGVAEAATDEVPLVKDGKAAAIYVDPAGADYDGLSLVAKSFAGDVKLVTGLTPSVATDSSALSGTVVIAGSIGNNRVIDALIAAGKLDVSAVKGKWETYKIQVIDNPVAGVSKGIVVAGSDKRGAIYGVYHISEQIGVSPWVYWGDVVPVKQTNLLFTSSQLAYTSKEPSVKYRGIFLNDEAPSLSSWAAAKFGGFNEDFYDKMFEVLLRLKGNYMWPAMWSNSFSDDGKVDKLANAKHADAYGVVMGTSHHEPMFRAGVEWQRVYAKYGTNNHWDWATNKTAITNFWIDGVKRNKNLDSVVTVGMRGESDSPLLPNGTMQENIDTLKEVITVQKQILKDNGLENIPKVLVVYKEVLDYWYGNSTVAGLKDWDGLKDVTVMLAEDNNGNVRTLPESSERNRAAGWGMYYHFDYVGGPKSYVWVDTVPLEKTWEQMSMAYDYGAKTLWVVNVGDFKPMELSTSYFLDMAYDFDKYGTNGINKTSDYTKMWVQQQFGGYADASTISGIADVMTGYLRLNGANKPEATKYSTFSTTNYNEVVRELDKANRIIDNAQKYYDLTPAAYKDAYYQLVYYPAVASANVRKMQLYAALNTKYYGFYRQSVLANYYAALTEKAIQTDQDLQSYYNNTMASGKWKGMMSSPHVGYASWNAESGAYPTVTYMTPVDGQSVMVVDVEGGSREYTSGNAALPAFTNIGKESYGITISNGGTNSFTYNVSADANWIKLDNTQGTVQIGKTIGVSVDWSKVSSNASGVITITGAGQTVKVAVSAQVIGTSGFAAKTFVETNNAISIEAERSTNRVAKSGVEWKTIANYGRTLSSVKMYPTTTSFTTVANAPYLEYSIYANNSGNYTLTAYTAPSNNLSGSSRMQFAVAVDGGAATIADTLPAGFKAGDSGNGQWTGDVLRNAHLTTVGPIALSKGTHTLRFYGIDAGLVLQKLVLSYGTPLASYYGPEESYYVGRTDSIHPLVKDVDADSNAAGLNLFPAGKMVPSAEYADAPFTEKNGAVAIEAELAAGRTNNANITDTNTNGHTWSVVTGQATKALQFLPDSGFQMTATDAASLATTPKLSYKINIATPGNYTVWALNKTSDSNADSVHVGLDNQFLFSYNGMNTTTNWKWTKLGTISSITAGTHDLNFWGREDGLVLDRIYLTTSTATADPVWPSSNVDLSSLNVSGGTFSPAFAANVTRYTASVASTVQNVTITASAANSSAAVAINGVSGTSVKVNLTGGSTQIPVTVKALDNTLKTYWITIGSTASAYSETNGIVAIEAEDAAARTSSATIYDANTNGHTWSAVAGQSTGALQFLPDNGFQMTATDAASLATTPRLAYTITISNPGNYNVWVLNKTSDYNSDSIHVGWDNQYKMTANGMNTSTDWKWTNVGTLASVTTGTHELDFWGREDGLVLDRIYLTTNTSNSDPVWPVSTFIEKNGVVTIEAEAAAGRTANATIYDTNTNGHTWSAVAGQSTGALQFLPDNGFQMTATDAASLATTPRLAYKMTISTPGNYTVWVFNKTSDYNSDSVHVGWNNQYSFSFNGMNTSTDWKWTKLGTITNVTAGTQELDFWGREDGLILDRIYLTTSTSTADPVWP